MGKFLIDINLKGKTSLITGATKGLGRGAAIAIAEAGGNVIAVGRNQMELDSLGKIIRNLKVKYTSFSCDVNNYNQMKLFIGQLKKILGLKFKRILFDNMSISQLKKCLKLCNKKYETEYSGNANLGNIKKISRTGVNRISVGAITHSAKTFDTSLLLG